MSKSGFSRRNFLRGSVGLTVANFVPGTTPFAQAATMEEQTIAAAKTVGKADVNGMIWSPYLVPMKPVIAEFTKVGLNQFVAQSELQDRWNSLTHREQQVVALVCLRHRNYEIAQTLGIAPETVKTHLQHIFDKLHLRGSKELRIALKDWDFKGWWEDNQYE